MAQLRDVKTSECVFEGTPYEVALMAEKVGKKEVIFDDVGLGFDPQSVIDAERERLAAFEPVAKSRAKSVDADTKGAAKDHVQWHDATTDAIDARVAEVEAAIQEARSRLKG